MQNELADTLEQARQIRVQLEGLLSQAINEPVGDSSKTEKGIDGGNIPPLENMANTLAAIRIEMNKVSKLASETQNILFD